MKANQEVKLTNEELFELAIAGDEKSLVKLFYQVKKLWSSRQVTPFDSYNLNSYDDWQSIATAKFFESWSSYDPLRGMFSTYIFKVVKNAWRNELRKQGLREIRTSLVDDISELMFTNYQETNGLDWVEPFLIRFEDSLYQEKSKAKRNNLLAVCRACFECGGVSITEIGHQVGMTRQFASINISLLKSRLADFIQSEQDLKYDVSIQS